MIWKSLKIPVDIMEKRAVLALSPYLACNFSFNISYKTCEKLISFSKTTALSHAESVTIQLIERFILVIRIDGI